VLAAVGVFLTGIVVEQDLLIRMGAHGPVSNAVRALLFPESALDQVWQYTQGRADAIATPLLRISAYSGAWLAMGAAGIRRTVNRGGVAAAQDSQCWSG
jgi:hypothetical protein